MQQEYERAKLIITEIDLRELITTSGYDGEDPIPVDHGSDDPFEF